MSQKHARLWAHSWKTNPDAGFSVWKPISALGSRRDTVRDAGERGRDMLHSFGILREYLESEIIPLWRAWWLPCKLTVAWWGGSRSDTRWGEVGCYFWEFCARPAVCSSNPKQMSSCLITRLQPWHDDEGQRDEAFWEDPLFCQPQQFKYTKVIRYAGHEKLTREELIWTTCFCQCRHINIAIYLSIYLSVLLHLSFIYVFGSISVSHFADGFFSKNVGGLFTRLGAFEYWSICFLIVFAKPKLKMVRVAGMNFLRVVSLLRLQTKNTEYLLRLARYGKLSFLFLLLLLCVWQMSDRRPVYIFARKD